MTYHDPPRKRPAVTTSEYALVVSIILAIAMIGVIVLIGYYANDAFMSSSNVMK